MKKSGNIPAQALMRYANMLGFGELHTRIDRESGMHSIIAIHSTRLGPAIGGCRFKEYKNFGHAMKDVLRLAFMMTLKAAVSDLPHGGAKAVIIKPTKNFDRKAIFTAFGEFVHEMNGRYISAMDFGTQTTDMDVIAHRTPYVIGASKTHAGHTDPGPYTALGVLRAIEASVKFKLQRDSLEGIRVAIQGAGHVGYTLSKLLHERGATITITDPQAEASQRCADEFNATVVSLDDIYSVDCDVFSPCALGGVINHATIEKITAPIIAGSANNQLAHNKYGNTLKEKGILYAPDFVANSGGLINAAMVYDYNDIDLAVQKIEKLYEIMLELFHRAKSENKPTADVAQEIALEKLRTKKRDNI